ncbi:hypothetical protein D3C87_1523200 [compost metagenome]
MIVAAGRKAVGENEQRLLFDIQHPPIVGPGIGRKRDVNEDCDGQIVNLRTAHQMDAVAPLPAGRQIGAGAHDGVKIEIGTVDLRAQDFVAWAQHLELAPDPPDQAPGFRREFGPVFNARGRSGQDAAMILEIARRPVVPLGIGEV